MSELRRPVNKRALLAWVNEQLQQGVPRWPLYLRLLELSSETSKSSESSSFEEMQAFYEVAESLLDIVVDRNLKGIELEKKRTKEYEDQAIALYEANIANRFGGSHPYERLRLIYFRNGDYANVSRVCRAYISFGQRDPALQQKYKKQADGIDRFLSAETNRSLGNASPICPHCGGALLQMPTKAMKCALCHKDIRVRTRHSDHKRVVVTPDEAEMLDEQWAMVQGRLYECDKQRRLEVRASLAEKFGRTPSERDVEWKLLNEDLLTCAGKQDWPAYRDTRQAMAKLLSREKKHKDALATLLEVCYLDINGPIVESESLGRWAPKFGRLNSRIVERIVKTARAGDFTSEAVHSLFIERATLVQKALHLPVAADTGWDQLSTALQELARRAQVT